ncbi:MAG: copper amine oxidase N-terminal domain-containing protein [Ruminococcaceae bacterium]|nr:copper amine oxidase N-terminal domain-containing protein [Oscillospiraceae bacterium]
MKKLISLLITSLLLVTCTGVFAEDEMYVYTPKHITVTYNGDPIIFPDAHPIMQNSRTLVPIRAIMERANLNVDYSSETKTITATQGALSITMTIDNPEATITKGENSRTVTMDVAPAIINGRTYVPVRFVSECLDINVNWNALANEVVLIDPAEWKREIETRAKMLNVLLDMPFASDTAYAGNFSGLMQLGYIFKNLPAETGLAPKTTACLDYNLTGTNVYDGNIFTAYAVLDIDLSALKTLSAAKGEADIFTFDEIATKHKIDLDMLMDEEWNLYIKSNGLLSLMEKTGQEAYAKAIGSRYIKISLNDMIEGELPDMSACKTYWDVFAASVRADNMLYTQSAALLDDMVDTYIDRFSNDSLKITERYNGTHFWSMNVSQQDMTDFKLDMARLTAISSGEPVDEGALAEQKKELDSAKVKNVITVLMENDVPAKVEFTDFYETGDEPIAPTVSTGKMPTVQKTNKLNFGASIRKFNSYKDKKTEVPKDVITLDELKQIQ